MVVQRKCGAQCEEVHTGVQFRGCIWWFNANEVLIAKRFTRVCNSEEVLNTYMHEMVQSERGAARHEEV
jgi:hypothetical protein